ncbi:polysaccharide biosynthesis protein [Anaerocolumna aminovalerica]|uniref:Stage V sporulation protein B n=2 Tax=Anaerocolumna aminovalerica TaxID=1527 RepID=A0A1I5FCX3_9FIRM|nr:polysaccharide biosynthesis protein [Anaerocolumna aminovalerica]MBU5331784.1 polysaccharide biosynthesis protein [Anaerocolumna aminovalerica]SFO21608.1 stage V sporulation protein B [Anaerocolumna aminovalerica]
MSKSNLIKGTAILTIAGLLTRLIGFFYRIYLSNAMGAELIGVYQLVFPVYGICFTIYASGIQTAISTMVATELGKKHYKNIPKILKIGMVLSVGIALLLSVLIYFNSETIASNILMEPSSASSLKILAYVFPFCGMTACINGYYYGLKKAGVPATTQLLEQTVRVITVYVLAGALGGGNPKVTCELAVLGIVIGEIFSDLYNIISLFCTSASREVNKLSKISGFVEIRNRSLANVLVKLALPLTGNRLLISILHSVEAIIIPSMLKKHGLSNSEALSVYGTLTGMSIPFIMFPSAITNSLSVLLLPTISEAQASRNYDTIRKTSALSIKYSILIGILSMGVFLTFGKELGNVIFNNELAGDLLMTLAWMCPFLYITTTLSSIINGLGKAHLTFANSIVGHATGILLILWLVPRDGIRGYLISLLISQLVITSFDGFIVIKNIKPSFHSVNLILKPGIIIAGSSYLIYRIYEYIAPTGILMLLAFCALLCMLYVILLGITKAISIKDFK